MRVLVCGGRHYSDREKLFSTLSQLHAATPITLIIHGGANGADSLAGVWARENGIPVQTFDADWSSHGRAAGPIRNSAMLKEGKPHLVVAFPGGRGTGNLMGQARALGVGVVDIP